MKMILLSACLLCVTSFAQTLNIADYQRDSWNRHVTDCDRAAAHGSDPEAVYQGITSEEMDKEGAVKACRQALTQDPANPRLHYQLGRSLTYSGRFETARPHLEKAAMAGYPQALFVLGYVETVGVGDYNGNPCLGGYLIRQSALVGRFAGLVGLPHYTLQGAYDECSDQPRRDAAEMVRFLDLAAGRADDFYRKALVSQLKTRICREMVDTSLPGCP